MGGLGELLQKLRDLLTTERLPLLLVGLRNPRAGRPVLRTVLQIPHEEFTAGVAVAGFAALIAYHVKLQAIQGVVPNQFPHFHEQEVMGEFSGRA